MKRVLLFFATLWLGIMGASAQSNKYDLNDDGVVNVTDVIQLVNYILGKENGSQGGQETQPHEAVDLGLPSGTKWATCNVGASKPEEYGGYYAWGETEEKEVYTWDTYTYWNGTEVVLYSPYPEISGTEYDVAHVKWGGDWVMPSIVDFDELLCYCSKEWTMLNGVNGLKLTSNINGNSIFLPAAGHRWDVDPEAVGDYGYYWSSSTYIDYEGVVWTAFASSIDFGSDNYASSSFFYYCGSGFSVRPVVRN